MKVFKFGGASVKDAEAVQNVGKVLELFPNQEIVVVVSAMGKTTNALENTSNMWDLRIGAGHQTNKNVLKKTSISCDLGITFRG